MKAKFVSVWDGGIELRTSCQFNPETKDVTDIDSVEAEGLDLLDEQFIELPSGEKITEFTIEGEEV